MPRSVVLVTGVSRFLGSRLAARLDADPSVARVIGVDTVVPGRDLRDRLGGTEFVRADIRKPVIAKVIAAAGVDTVVHTSASATPADAGGRGPMKELNVIGTMQLLAACQQSTTVRRLVVRSTTAVYGAGPKDPAVFTEDTSPTRPLTSGYARDAVEVEEHVRGFTRRRPDVAVCVLRYTHLVGPQVTSAFTRYVTLPVVPTVLGYDPRIQVVHEEDALEVLHRAAVGSWSGEVNVAASGVLLLSQAIRRAGRVAVPVPPPATALVARMLRQTGVLDFSTEQARLLCFGRVVDTTRLHDDFGFSPRFSTAGAFDDFLAGRGTTPLLPPGLLSRAERAALALAGGSGSR